jgi:acyl-CoA synthetase (AMP-forming)/AMP-acid ligase II/thioesterase domain-containing protein/acyl carrier protein
MQSKKWVSSTLSRKLGSDTNVIIIGAGIAGIVTARELIKKGCKVRIIEKNKRIAGKCDTFELDGFEYNLGGHVLSQNGTVKKLAESVGVNVVSQPFSGADEIGEFCLYDFEKGLLPRSFDMIEKIAAAQEIFEKHEGLKIPGYTKCTDLAAPLKDWLEHNDLEEMYNDFKHAYTCAGYGFWDGNLSAAYYLKYVQANDMGLKPTCTPEGGFRHLLATLAEGIDIRLDEAVISVDRKSKTVQTSKDTYSFDELIVCCPNTAFMDFDPEEKALFSKVKTLPYVTVIMEILEFPDTKLFNLIDQVKPGHTAAFARFNPDSEVYNVYAYLEEGMTIDALLENIKSDFMLAGASVGKVHFVQKWDYFPHVSPKNFAEGFYDKLDALQGHKSSWYLGSLVAFELTNSVVENIIQFVAERMSIDSKIPAKHSPFQFKQEAETAFENIIEAINYHLERTPYKHLYTCLDKKHSWNYKEITAEAAIVAQKLLNLNLTNKDAVLLIYPPDSQYFPVGMLACLLAGVIAVPLAPLTPNANQLELKRFHHIVNELNCKYVLSDTLYKTAVVLSAGMNKLKNVFNKKTLAWPKLTWLRTDAIKGQADWLDLAEKQSYAKENIAYLQYTSGSMSYPKAVTVTHQKLVQNLHIIAIESNTQKNSVFLGWVPWFHDMGLVAGFLSAAYCGVPHYFYSPISFLKSPISWLKYIDQYKVTSIAAPNFGYELAAKRISEEDSADLDLSSITHAAYGGERTRSSTAKAFFERFAKNGLKADSFRNVYGMAESVLYISGADAPPSTYNFSQKELNQGRAIITNNKKKSIELVSVGAVPINLGVSILIVHPELKKICPTGSVGEIWISSPSVAPFYYNNETATQECFEGKLEGEKGTFMRTGDLGFMYKGELFICGRAKELIIYGGRNIYPEDIELLASNASSIIRKGCVAAFGLDAVDTEQLVVIAELKSQKNINKEQHLEAVQLIQKELSENLAISNSCIVLVKARTLVKTSSGKLRRKQIKQDFLDQKIKSIYQSTTINEVTPSIDIEEGENIEITPRSKEEIVDWLLNEFSEKYNLLADEIDTTVPLSTLGIDSISVLVFVQRLSKWLGFHVELSAFYYHPSISELARYLSDSQDLARQNIPLKERLLVTINPELTGEPIYAIRPAGGSVMGYTELSNKLNRPIIALQAESQITHKVSIGEDVEPLAVTAKKYAQILLDKKLKVETLIGFSWGGICAFEMAKYLPDLKQVILIDSAGPGHGPGQGGDDKTPYLDNAAKRLEIIQIGWAIIFPLIRELNRYNYFPAGVRDQFFADSEAFLSYYPTKTTTVKTTIIRASVFDDRIERSFQHPHYRSDDFGWRLADPDISIVKIPGAHHFTIMIDPYIELVADVINDLLEHTDL